MKKMNLEDIFWNLNIPEWHIEFESYRENLSTIFPNISKKVENWIPEKEKVFKFLELTPYDKVKVVIWGQDPYPTPGVAQGYSFGSPTIQKSLDNIFKEIKENYSFFRKPTTGNLTRWCNEGVLLANMSLTLIEEENVWEDFTKILIDILNRKDFCIHVLWGSKVKTLKKHITSRFVLESGNPSPFSYEKYFKGNENFRKINNIIRKNTKTEKEINWQLLDDTIPTTHFELMKIKYKDVIGDKKCNTYEELKKIVNLQVKE